VKQPPLFTAFKPVSVRRLGLETVLLTLDEYEAVRLADNDSLAHAQAAKKMGISRPTFTRLIDIARKKLADFIINGKQLQILGGCIHFSSNIFKCNECGKVVSLPIAENILNCPLCDSENIVNLALAQGHGDCCNELDNEK
jgi:predicted DNA-binding protein (UPF0251 family)